MSSRVAGASLALIAAPLLAVSLATPAVVPAELSLFAGHPTVKGHTLELQDVYVGFYGAELCNTGGDGTCRSRDPQTSFRLTARAELGVTGLLAASLLVLALLTVRKSERRKTAAWLVGAVAVLAAAGAGALIYLGPTDEGTIPVGPGLWLYGSGVLGALLASLLSARPPPPLTLRVAGHGVPPDAPQRPPVPVSGPYDQPLRPGDVAGEAGHARDLPPSSWHFVGASDVFVRSGPQLRPLYDAEPQHGGTGGLQPPGKRPSPRSRDAFDVAAEAPVTPPSPARATPNTPSPPHRAKPPSVAPPTGEPPPAPPPASSFTDEVQIVSRGSSEEIAFPGPTTAVLPNPPAPPERGQLSTDPRMQDDDAPIPPPTAQVPRFETPASASDFESTTFPRIEPPIAERAAPIPPAPPRDQKPTRPPPPPPPPARRSTSIPPIPALGAPRTIPPPRPLISPPIASRPSAFARPAIPAIPAIPALPKRSDASVTDPHADPHAEQPTVVSLPIEVGDTSQTDVSYDHPVGESIGGSGESIDVALDPTVQSGEIDGPVTGGRPRLRRSDVTFELDTPRSAPPVFQPGQATGDVATVRAPVAWSPSPLPNVPSTPVVPPSELPEPPVLRDRLAANLSLSTAPDSLPPPNDSKPSAGPSPACPQCESPMVWVEEHLRFYCKSCRMYF